MSKVSTIRLLKIVISAAFLAASITIAAPSAMADSATYTITMDPSSPFDPNGVFSFTSPTGFISIPTNTSFFVPLTSSTDPSITEIFFTSQVPFVVVDLGSNGSAIFSLGTFSATDFSLPALYFGDNFTFDVTTATPEPGSLPFTLSGIALLGMILALQRRSPSGNSQVS